MKPDSRSVVHIGINFLTAPPPVVGLQQSLAFQQAILASGLEFVRVENPPNGIQIVREAPYPLHITAGLVEQGAGQLLCISPQPRGSLELFIQEVEAALSAFETTWPAPNRQLLRCDATLRELHDASTPHAFQEIWEGRLGQPLQALAPFARPVRGGGLRLVLEPLPGEADPLQIELRIESYLRDPSKLYLEIQMNWLRPQPPAAPFDPRRRLTQLNGFVEESLYGFLNATVPVGTAPAGSATDQVT